MEKLIERLSNGQAAVLGCGDNCKYNFKYCESNMENCPTLCAIYEKLAQYEETGLTPDQIKKMAYAGIAKETACRPNYEEELKIRCAEIMEMKSHLSAVMDERGKLGLEYEQALKHNDELVKQAEFLKGQIEAYQYCMNCRR